MFGFSEVVVGKAFFGGGFGDSSFVVAGVRPRTGSKEIVASRYPRTRPTHSVSPVLQRVFFRMRSSDFRGMASPILTDGHPRGHNVPALIQSKKTSKNPFQYRPPKIKMK